MLLAEFLGGLSPAMITSPVDEPYWFLDGQAEEGSATSLFTQCSHPMCGLSSGDVIQEEAMSQTLRIPSETSKRPADALDEDEISHVKV